MKNISDDIKKLGFGEWFQDKTDPDKLNGLIARVIAVHKDSYVITNGENDIFAELVGKLLYNADSPLDYPAVGDWVCAHFHDEGTAAVIHEVLPRKSLLKRKTSGKKIDFQLIAANIDTAFIVQSLDANYNLRRLERYLVMIYESNIQPIVLLSKSDLMASEEIETKIAAIKQIMPNVQVQPFSNENGLKQAAPLLSIYNPQSKSRHLLLSLEFFDQALHNVRKLTKDAFLSKVLQLSVEKKACLEEIAVSF